MVENGGSSVASKPSQRSGRQLPDWFKITLPTGEALATFNDVRITVRENQLHTVCQEARCPNMHECWSRGTATFMIAGQECTRGCRFCAVGSIKTPPPLDAAEPESLARAVGLMGLEHAVITVVNRDDLPDSGASHYRLCLEAVRERCPEVSLELLCSDLAGDVDVLAELLDGLDLQVFAHNVECVPRLDSRVRDPRASFQQSLRMLREAKRLRPDLLTKSSLMVGLGERDEEIDAAMLLCREAGVDLMTIGQYLQPNQRLLSVERYPPPAAFEHWRLKALELGFLGVASGPLVRSSYRAGTMLKAAEELQKQSKAHNQGESA